MSSSEDWDLFAVVRSCSSSTINTTNSCGGHGEGGNSCTQQDPLPLFTNIQGDMESSSSCKPFLPAATTTSCSPLPPPPVIVSSAPNVLMKQEQGLFESQDQKPSSKSSLFVFRSQRDHLLQQQQSHAPLRSGKRKNRQKKIICHVTQENLSCDMWAWRKYGQKPIKGSPYPRNYYRCSSSKGCLARKQVERSNLDPNIFIVTYTGDHTHPRPTHRNSLAGSTRNKSQPANPTPRPDPSRSDIVKEETHLSPTTPLNEDDETKGDEDMNSQEVNMEDGEDEVEDDDENDDVDDLLVPNFAARDRDDLFFAGEPPPWSVGSAGDGGG